MNGKLLLFFYKNLFKPQSIIYKSSGVNSKTRYYFNTVYGKNTCSITKSTSGFISYHQIIVEIYERGYYDYKPNILPVEENTLKLLKNTRFILIKYLIVLYRTYKKYQNDDKVLSYCNVLNYLCK